MAEGSDIASRRNPAEAIAGRAAETESNESQSSPGTREERLDALFVELKRESSAPKAAQIASRIESVWNESGSATIDLLLQWSGEAMANDQGAAALDLIDQAIALRPQLAELWNRRATLHFTSDRISKSISDLQQVLRREPRHFNALIGLATIFQQIGRKEQALDIYMRVLDVYPANQGAQSAVSRLAEELAGDRA
ncbi:tetratricopeptide repeat protein [Consotaella salsifontis]|nr:hypothetical protein [Consotaella salsifontis]